MFVAATKVAATKLTRSAVALATTPFFDFSSDLMCLTGTLYGEARGQSRMAKEDVAQAILNRVRSPHWQATIHEVCLAHDQFSCWNLSDPNRTQIIMASLQKVKQPAWLECLDVAQKALVGHNPDRINRADSYYAVGSPRPWWADPIYGCVVTYQDDAHIFLKTR